MAADTQTTTATETSGSSDIDRAQAALMDRFGGDDRPEEEPTPEQPSEDQPDDAPEEAEAEAPDAEADEDDAPETDDEEGADEPEEEPTEAPKLYRVKVDGKELEVSEDELKAGYQRQADYTRKTQEIAEARKVAETERQAIIAERQQAAQAREHYLGRLSEMEQAYDAVQEPNWQALLQEANQQGDWSTYNEQRLAWEQLVKQREGIKAEKAKAEQERQAEWQRHQSEQQKQQAKFIAEERERLFERIPDWKDEAKRAAEIAEITKFGREHYGLTDEELGRIIDHRHLLVLRDAILHRKSQAKAREKVQAVTAKKAPPRVQAPTAPAPQRTAQTEKARNMKRLRQSGSTEDAARLLLERM